MNIFENEELREKYFEQSSDFKSIYEEDYKKCKLIIESAEEIKEDFSLSSDEEEIAFREYCDQIVNFRDSISVENGTNVTPMNEKNKEEFFSQIEKYMNNDKIQNDGHKSREKKNSSTNKSTPKTTSKKKTTKKKTSTKKKSVSKKTTTKKTTPKTTKKKTSTKTKKKEDNNESS